MYLLLEVRVHFDPRRSSSFKQGSILNCPSCRRGSAANQLAQCHVREITRRLQASCQSRSEHSSIFTHCTPEPFWKATCGVKEIRVSQDSTKVKGGSKQKKTTTLNLSRDMHVLMVQVRYALMNCDIVEKQCYHEHHKCSTRTNSPALGFSTSCHVATRIICRKLKQNSVI